MVAQLCPEGSRVPGAQWTPEGACRARQFGPCVLRSSLMGTGMWGGRAHFLQPRLCCKKKNDMLSGWRNGIKKTKI